jgi:hypothetical protein
VGFAILLSYPLLAFGRDIGILSKSSGSSVLGSRTNQGLTGSDGGGSDQTI